MQNLKQGTIWIKVAKSVNFFIFLEDGRLGEGVIGHEGLRILDISRAVFRFLPSKSTVLRF